MSQLGELFLQWKHFNQKCHRKVIKLMEKLLTRSSWLNLKWQWNKQHVQRKLSVFILWNCNNNKMIGNKFQLMLWQNEHKMGLISYQKQNTPIAYHDLMLSLYQNSVFVSLKHKPHLFSLYIMIYLVWKWSCGWVFSFNLFPYNKISSNCNIKTTKSYYIINYRNISFHFLLVEDFEKIYNMGWCCFQRIE